MEPLSAEILTIGSVDHYTISDGGMGPVTIQIEQLFHDVVRGRRPEYNHWLTPAGAA